MSTSGSFRLFSVRGIPIRLHWTFFLVLPYVALGMARQFEAFAASAHTSRDALLLSPGLWGVVLAIFLFASVLLHELGHVFVAQSQGSPVRGVTLMLLGGVSHIERVSRREHDEAKMAVIGPVVSLGIALVSYAIWAVSSGLPPDLRFGLFYLAQMNLAVAVFNMLPAFPLDGGRVLRSMLEPHYGRIRATQIAAAIGRVLAVAMGIFGVLFGNFLLVLIAVFVWGGGTAEASAVLHHERLAGLQVGQVTDTTVGVLSGIDSVEHAAATMVGTRVPAVLVHGRNGEVGLVTAGNIARVREQERAATPLEAIASFDLPIANASDSAADALDAMLERDLELVPVVRGNWLVGVLSRESVMRRVELDDALHRPSHA